MQTIGAALRVNPRRLRTLGCERGALALVLCLVAGQAVAQAGSARPPQSAGTRPDFSGSWERYRGPAGDPHTPPPESSPPLRGQLLAEWQARQAAARAADARGEPIATGYVHCLPDGVPSMMSGPFPFEILQGRDQMNIAQEAYSQVRREP